MTGLGKTLVSATVSATVEALQYRLHMDSVASGPSAALHSVRHLSLAQDRS